MNLITYLLRYSYSSLYTFTTFRQKFCVRCRSHRSRNWIIIFGLRSVLCVVERAIGVAQLDNVVYVACLWSPFIRTFNADTLSPLNNDIHVVGMKYPRDMVVCRTQRQLFIADSQAFYNCIWRVAVDQLQNEKWMETEYQIESLSVTSQRLLVTSPRPSEPLRLVRMTDAAQIGVVRLPEYMHLLHHAVETTRGTCVVAHWGTSQDKWQCAVSRVVTCCVALFITVVNSTELFDIFRETE